MYYSLFNGYLAKSKHLKSKSKLRQYINSIYLKFICLINLKCIIVNLMAI